MAASQRLKLPRATLHRRIGELEASVGVLLLERTPRGVDPTQAGRTLVDQGRRLLLDADALLGATRSAAAGVKAEIRVAIPVGLPPHVFPPMLAFAGAQFPGIRIRLFVTEDPLKHLALGADLALSWDLSIPDGQWVAHDLIALREWLVASPGYLEARGTPTTAEELKQHTLLSWEPPEGGAERWPLLAGGELLVEPALSSNDVHALRGVAAAGLGIVFAPDGLLPAPEPEMDALVPVLDDVVGRQRVLRLVVPTSLDLMPQIRDLVAATRGFVERVG
jgi:DNA-binding transcriptional LysR family regulator